MARIRWKNVLLPSITICLLLGFFQNCGPAKVSTQTSTTPDLQGPSSVSPSPTPPVPTPTPTPQSSFKITSQPVANNITSTSVTITWSLSEAATGQVDFGFTTNYGSVSDPELSFDYSTHIQDIDSLKPGTTYHFRIRSTSMDGYEVLSNDMTFTTRP